MGLVSFNEELKVGVPTKTLAPHRRLVSFNEELKVLINIPTAAVRRRRYPLMRN